MALYDNIGRGYATLRRPDPRIAAAINAAVGDAASVVNVGAGSGSYEPPGTTVLAVEPSEVMIRQRPAPPLAAPCVQGSAESLPVATASVDAAMSILSAHHWSDLDRGLGEMARIARKRVVMLTWVPDAPNAVPFWLTKDYFPEIIAHDRTIFPDATTLAAKLERAAQCRGESGGESGGGSGGVGGSATVRMRPLPIPHDCLDGLLCAYWRRPESYLSAEIRAAMSSFARIDATAGIARLRADLESGRWAERNGHLRTLDALDLGYCIVTCELNSTKQHVD